MHKINRWMHVGARPDGVSRSTVFCSDHGPTGLQIWVTRAESRRFTHRLNGIRESSGRGLAISDMTLRTHNGFLVLQYAFGSIFIVLGMNPRTEHDLDCFCETHESDVERVLVLHSGKDSPIAAWASQQKRAGLCQSGNTAPRFHAGASLSASDGRRMGTVHSPNQPRCSQCLVPAKVSLSDRQAPSSLLHTSLTITIHSAVQVFLARQLLRTSLMDHGLHGQGVDAVH